MHGASPPLTLVYARMFTHAGKDTGCKQFYLDEFYRDDATKVDKFRFAPFSMQPGLVFSSDHGCCERPAETSFISWQDEGDYH